jgi:hypothetical protein
MKKWTLTFLVLMACTNELDFPNPLLNTVDVPKVSTTINAVWERVYQNQTGFVKFEIDKTPLWLSGYVTSSDASGNFFKELYIQDQPENPTRALRLLLDKTALHTFYIPGMKIYVKLNGLGAGMERGIMSLGAYQADGIAALAEPLIENHIQRSNEVLDIIPRRIPIENLSETTRGIFIQLEGVQFSSSEKNKTFAGEEFDLYDGERWIVSCETFRSIILSSSTFSKFKSVVVDSLSGTLSGIYSRDYYNEKDLLKINFPADIDFKNQRCDPFFEESFENLPKGRFQVEGWINWIEKGSVYWQIYEDESSLGQSLRIGSYRSKDSESICWLISPSFRLSSLASPFFSFRSSTAFSDESVLEVFYSTNFDGDRTRIKQANWRKLDVNIASELDNDQLWIDSGEFPLNKNVEKIYFAFRYTGSGKTASDGTFELDDIRIFDKVKENQ